MKKLTLWVSIVTIIVMCSAMLFAEDPRKDENWRNDYLTTLKKGKAIQLPSGQSQPAAGLAYTLPEAVALQEAITKALEKEKGDRVCECMKIAVDMEYNPYLVIKTIYEAGGDLEIDQLCMCASEAGVMKAIIAKAAKEAVSKALGTGIGRISWRDIEILRGPERQPVLVLYGEAHRLAGQLGLSQWSISLSHTQGHAIAFVVATD